MKLTKFATFASIGLAILLIFGIDSNTFAQGRGGGRPSSNPGSGAGRPTTSPGVDRGIGTAGSRSNGRSDDGLGTASRNSNGRSDAGIDRARLMRENSNQANREIERNPRVGDNLNMNANDLRSSYQSALETNPNLKFGQFVAANMIARHLGARNSNVTTESILGGLANGDSIGETLRDLGVSKEQAKRAEKEAKQKIKDKRND